MVIYLDSLLTSKIHSIFNFKNKFTKIFAVLRILYIFLHGQKLYHLVLLQTWPKISQAIGYGDLYFIYFLHVHCSTCHHLTPFVEIKNRVACIQKDEPGSTLWYVVYMCCDGIGPRNVKCFLVRHKLIVY